MPATLADLIFQVRSAADMSSTTFLTDAEITNWINISIGELHDVVVTINPEKYIISADIIGAANTDSYLLPNDFYKQYRLFYKASNGSRTRIGEFQLSELGASTSIEAHNSHGDASRLRYRILGTKLMFYPTPTAIYNFEMWYIPQAKTLLEPYDVVNYNLPLCWIDYIISDVAAKALEKEESDSAPQLQRKQAALSRIMQVSQPTVDLDGYASADPTSLGQLTNSVRVQSGASFDAVSDTELAAYVNASANELYDILLQKQEDIFVKQYQFKTVSSVASYPVPEDFYKLLKIYLNYNDENYVLSRFMFDDLGGSTLTNLVSPNYQYRVMGSTIYFYSTPDSAYTIDMFYVPQNAPLLKPQDRLNANLPKSAAQYIIDDCIARVLTKLGKDPTLMLSRKAEALTRMASVPQPRDHGQASRVLCTYSDDGDY